MKRSISILSAVAVIGLVAASAFAQTGGGMTGSQKQEGMGVQHSSQTMSGQMTGEDMFRDMAGR